IGATTRQQSVERSGLIAERLPLLAKMMPWIGHTATRARGTVGGSLANADPAAELELAAITLDATLTYRLAGKSVDTPASEFFLGAMTTALPAGACLAAVRFPAWPEHRIGTGFHEVSARRSDFAFASAAAQVAVDEDGTCRRIAVGVGAVTESPLRLLEVERQLTGTRLEDSKVRDVVRGALADIETMSDLHATADYRRRVAAKLAMRAILDAGAECKAKSHAH
ncbi:MAG: FAD binding domain-containing protein, partial [Rhodospirillaceae bacterium]